MFVFGGMFLGAVLGGLTARRRGGRPLDIAQWAAAWGIIGTILGVFLTVAINRMFAG